MRARAGRMGTVGAAALCACSAACGGPPTDEGGEPALGGPVLAIAAPVDGAMVDEGDRITLDAVGRGPDGAEVRLGTPRWELLDAEGAQGWWAEGDPLEVDDLPPGRWSLRCTAVVDDILLDDSIELNDFAAD